MLRLPATWTLAATLFLLSCDTEEMDSPEICLREGEDVWTSEPIVTPMILAQALLTCDGLEPIKGSVTVSWYAPKLGVEVDGVGLSSYGQGLFRECLIKYFTNL